MTKTRKKRTGQLEAADDLAVELYWTIDNLLDASLVPAADDPVGAGLPQELFDDLDSAILDLAAELANTLLSEVVDDPEELSESVGVAEAMLNFKEAVENVLGMELDWFGGDWADLEDAIYREALNEAR